VDDLTDEDVLTLLRQEVERAGGMQRFAEARGVSQSLVSMTLGRQRRVGPAIAAALGLVEAGRRWRRQGSQKR
jgi:DNA-binding phage protein